MNMLKEKEERKRTKRKKKKKSPEKRNLYNSYLIESDYLNGTLDGNKKSPTVRHPLRLIELI
jgi:hypothetical protein